MHHFSLRPATGEDREAIERCIEAAYFKYIERIGKKPAPMLADYQNLIAQQIVYVLVGEEGIRGVLVMRQEGESLWIENIAVDPRAQGQGLGRALMAFVEQQARANMLKEIRLYTNELMTENIHFYQQLGFQEEDRRIEDGYHRIFLHKTLQ